MATNFVEKFEELVRHQEYNILTIDTFKDNKGISGIKGKRGKISGSFADGIESLKEYKTLVNVYDNEDTTITTLDNVKAIEPPIVISTFGEDIKNALRQKGRTGRMARVYESRMNEVKALQPSDITFRSPIVTKRGSAKTIKDRFNLPDEYDAQINEEARRLGLEANL